MHTSFNFASVIIHSKSVIDNHSGCAFRSRSSPLLFEGRPDCGGNSDEESTKHSRAWRKNNNDDCVYLRLAGG